MMICRYQDCIECYRAAWIGVADGRSMAEGAEPGVGQYMAVMKHCQEDRIAQTEDETGRCGMNESELSDLSEGKDP